MEAFAISSRDFKGGEPYLSESLLQKLQPLPLMWSVWSTSSSWLQNKMKTVIVAEGCRCCRSLSLRCSQTTNESAWHFLQRDHSRVCENKPGIRVCPSNGSGILNYVQRACDYVAQAFLLVFMTGSCNKMHMMYLWMCFFGQEGKISWWNVFS